MFILLMTYKKWFWKKKRKIYLCFQYSPWANYRKCT